MPQAFSLKILLRRDIKPHVFSKLTPALLSKTNGPLGFGYLKKKTAHSALLETNSEFALENGWLEEVCRLPFGGQEMPIFRGALSGCWFQGGYGVDFPMAQKQLRPHCTCDQSAHPKLHRPGTPPGAILQLPPKKNRNPEKKKSFQLVGPGLLWYLYLMLPVSHNSKASTIFWGGFQVFGAELAINYQVFCFLQMFDQNTYQQKHLRRQVLPEKIQ